MVKAKKASVLHKSWFQNEEEFLLIQNNDFITKTQKSNSFCPPV